MKMRLLGVGLTLLAAQTSFADSAITAEHRLLSSIQQADGFHTVYEVSLRNTGTVSFADLSLIPADGALHLSETESNGLSVGALAAGGEKTAQWEVVTGAPIEQYIFQDTLYFGAEGVDSAGSSQSFPVSSTELITP